MNTPPDTPTVKQQLRAVLQALPVHPAITPILQSIVGAHREHSAHLASLPLPLSDREYLMSSLRSVLLEAITRLLTLSPRIADQYDQMSTDAATRDAILHQLQRAVESEYYWAINRADDRGEECPI